MSDGGGEVSPNASFTPAELSTGKVHIGLKIANDRVDIGFASLERLIALAYDVERYQIAGAQLDTQPFDVVAKMQLGTPREQVLEMLQALLAERFRLVVHREFKEQTVLALTIAKTGSKLIEAPLRRSPAVRLET